MWPLDMIRGKYQKQSQASMWAEESIAQAQNDGDTL